MKPTPNPALQNNAKTVAKRAGKGSTVNQSEPGFFRVMPRAAPVPRPPSITIQNAMSATDEGNKLNHIAELFIPTQCGVCREPLPGDSRSALLKDIKVRFSDAFEAFSVTPIQGGWKMPDGTLAEEAIDVVWANATTQKIEEHQEDLALWAVEVADRASQDCVALRIDGHMTFYPRSNPKAPCAHKTAGKAAGTPAAMLTAVKSARAPRPIDRLYAIQSLLSRFNSLADARALFCGTLGYTYFDGHLPTVNWPASLREMLHSQPQVISDTQGFQIVYLRLNTASLLRSAERAVINRILRDAASFYGLFIISDAPQKQWEFVNPKQEAGDTSRFLLRRIPVGGSRGVRTAAERLGLIDLDKPDRIDLQAAAIQKLHDQAFDVESVTKQFFSELSEWYFWALRHASFPKDAPKDANNREAISLIRLITRLIFCWFIKEKGLVPSDLFDEKGLQSLLKGFSPKDGKNTDSTFYRAILQNLFFATLNTEMDTPEGRVNRRFSSQTRDDHMIHTVWRYENLFADKVRFKELLKQVPFLNGGLFECLDDREGSQEIRIDGFSDNPKNQPELPDFLFFGPEQNVDLSHDFGDARFKRVTVRGLILTLQRYNFTVEESTPVDQEVALDPELLGHVFENLLANYNPETGAVARKTTGSFYTPRVAVNFMVDEALLVRLSQSLRGQLSLTEKDGSSVEARLRDLLDWHTEGHKFEPAEAERLIAAIHAIKAIDIACGSGAFPIGLLLKLVWVLRKLDPGNTSWKAAQLAAIPEPNLRAATERVFKGNLPDYTRKLYLIENCLYGVDILPIAVQITKLRFFISLIVDQRVDNAEPNRGVLALPNLETRIVAANSLIGFKRGQLLLASNDVTTYENELRQVRHDHFSARRFSDKKYLRKRDRDLCGKLAKALTDSGTFSSGDAHSLAQWDPYDQNTSASFFDPEWMFGLTTGFDISIGNPPFVRQEILRRNTVFLSGREVSLKDALKGRFQCYSGTSDLYVYFYERSIQLLKDGGVHCYISSNSYLNSTFGESLRSLLQRESSIRLLIDFAETGVFKAITEPCIIVTTKSPVADNLMRVLKWDQNEALENLPSTFAVKAITLQQIEFRREGWQLESALVLRLLDKVRKAGRPLGEHVSGRFYYGIKTGLNEAFIVNAADRARLVADHASSTELLKPFGFMQKQDRQL